MRLDHFFGGHTVREELRYDAKKHLPCEEFL